MEARFKALLESVVAALPDVKTDDTGVSIKDAIQRRLEREFAEPRVKELSLCLRTSLTGDRVRELLFFPSAVDCRLYPSLIASAPEGAPDAHPQNTIQVTALAMLYLVHSRSWDKIKEFILAGGLPVLASLFTLENPFLRSQAVDTFLQVTSHDGFDWFKEPKTDEDKAIHQQLLALARTPFLAHLVANYDSPFPGGSFFCLQIMAFWLSWARKLHTAGQPLALSQELLDTLKRWAARDDGTPEELELAKKLHDDFSRFPTAEAMATEAAKEAKVFGEGGGDTPQGSNLISVQSLELIPEEEEEEEEGAAAAGAGEPSAAAELDTAAAPEPAQAAAPEPPARQPAPAQGASDDDDDDRPLSAQESAVLAAILRRHDYGGAVRDIGEGTTEFDVAAEERLLSGKLFEGTDVAHGARAAAPEAAVDPSGPALARLLQHRETKPAKEKMAGMGMGLGVLAGDGKRKPKPGWGTAKSKPAAKAKGKGSKGKGQSKKFGRLMIPPPTQDSILKELE